VIALLGSPRDSFVMRLSASRFRLSLEAAPLARPADAAIRRCPVRRRARVFGQPSPQRPDRSGRPAAPTAIAVGPEVDPDEIARLAGKSAEDPQDATPPP
jgi:hypothetical protein